MLCVVFSSSISTIQQLKWENNENIEKNFNLQKKNILTGNLGIFDLLIIQLSI